MNYRKLKAGFFIFSMLFIMSCSKDGDDNVEPTAETYETEVEVTDAPIDNANISGAFVTISEVTINGKPLQGFEAKTVNLLELQNGATAALGTVALESGTTSSIVLKLNNEQDASGQAPGNYILTAANEKKALVAESSEIVLTQAAEIKANAENAIVLDFDLRKMIVADAETAGNYNFVSNSELQSSIRAVNKVNAGTIKGQVDDSNNTAEAIVVYAYEKGTYTESETTENNGVRFKGAVTSTMVNEADGAYSLHFLEEGEYELRFASYSENTEGEMTFQGMLEVSAAAGLDLSILGLPLEANGTTEANVVVTGVVQ